MKKTFSLLLALFAFSLSVFAGNPGERVSYAYADVQRMVVVDDVVSAIDNVLANDKSQHIVFSVSANALNVSGLAVGERFSLNAIDGKLMLSEKADADGKAAMNLSSLQQGIYVVRTQSGISYKLFKK